MNKHLPPNIQQLAKGPIALANPAGKDIDSEDIFTLPPKHDNMYLGCNYHHTTEASTLKKVFPNSSWSYLSDISAILWQWTGVNNSFIQKTVPTIGLGSGTGIDPGPN